MTYSPCAACKFLRRKCTQDCEFAPYFPPDQPQKFANVHRVFGKSNVGKLLNDIDESQREAFVNSLVFEAEARLRDPVYGCVGWISLLQKDLREMQGYLQNARHELATYIGPQAMLSIMQQPPMADPSPTMAAMVQHQSNMMQMMGIPRKQGGPVIREPNRQNFDTQQLAAAAAAREQQEMLSGQFHHQQAEQQFFRVNRGLEGGSSSQAATGFNHNISAAAGMSQGVLENRHHQPQPEDQQHPHAHPLEPHEFFLQPQHPQRQHETRDQHAHAYSFEAHGFFLQPPLQPQAQQQEQHEAHEFFLLPPRQPQAQQQQQPEAHDFFLQPPQQPQAQEQPDAHEFFFQPPHPQTQQQQQQPHAHAHSLEAHEFFLHPPVQQPRGQAHSLQTQLLFQPQLQQARDDEQQPAQQSEQQERPGNDLDRST